METLYKKFCKEKFNKDGILDDFEIVCPENFNFAYDVVDNLGKNYPDKIALKWCNILEKENDSSSVKAIAKKLSGISAREEEILEMQMKPDTFLNIKFFVESLNDMLKLNGVTLDIIVEKWMYLYSPTTIMGLELFPNFSAMITDAYVGCYINNQKTIEKITGRSMVEYTKTILSIGEGAV